MGNLRRPEDHLRLKPKDRLKMKPESLIIPQELLLMPIALIWEIVSWIFTELIITGVPLIIYFSIQSRIAKIIVLILYFIIFVLVNTLLIRRARRKRRERISNYLREESHSFSKELSEIKQTDKHQLDETTRTMGITDKPKAITIEEMKQSLPMHIDITEVNLIEEIIQDKDTISIVELCNRSGLDEDKVLEIAIDILGRKRYFKEIISADYFREMT